MNAAPGQQETPKSLGSALPHEGATAASTNSTDKSPRTKRSSRAQKRAQLEEQARNAGSPAEARSILRGDGSYAEQWARTRAMYRANYIKNGWDPDDFDRQVEADLRKQNEERQKRIDREREKRNKGPRTTVVQPQVPQSPAGDPRYPVYPQHPQWPRQPYMPWPQYPGQQWQVDPRAPRGPYAPLVPMQPYTQYMRTESRGMVPPPGARPPENLYARPSVNTEKAVKGFIYHVKEYQRIKQQERGFWGKMAHGLADPFLTYVGIARLNRFVSNYRSANGREPIFTDALVKNVLDNKGRLNANTEQAVRSAQVSERAHQAMLKLAVVGQESQDDPRRRLIARDLIGTILKMDAHGNLTMEQIQQLLEKNSEFKRRLLAQDVKDIADAVHSIYALGEASNITFQTTESFQTAVSDQLLYAGLTPRQQEQARKVARWAHFSAVTLAARYATIPLTGGLGLWGQIGASAVISGATRVPTLLGQGSLYKMNTMRGLQVRNEKARAMTAPERMLAKATRWMSVDWEKDSYPWQIVRATLFGAGLGAVSHGISHYADIQHAAGDALGNVGHHLGIGDASAHATTTAHSSVDAAIQAHTETTTQTFSFADFAKGHGVSNADFQAHVHPWEGAQHGATWAYDVSNHWTNHSMTWNVYDHGDQINYFTLHMPNNQVAIVDLAHSTVHHGQGGDYSFTFDANNTTDKFALMDLQGHPIGTITSQDAFHLWHTTGHLPSHGESSDFSYATQGYVRGLTEFGHFDKAHDAFVRYGEVQGHGGFGDLHQLQVTQQHEVAATTGYVSHEDGDVFVTPEGVWVHDVLEEVADAGGRVTDFIFTHPLIVGGFAVSSVAGFLMGRHHRDNPGSRSDMLFGATGLGLLATSALPYMSLANPAGLGIGYLVGRLGGGKGKGGGDKKDATSGGVGSSTPSEKGPIPTVPFPGGNMDGGPVISSFGQQQRVEREAPIATDGPGTPPFVPPSSSMPAPAPPPVVTPTTQPPVQQPAEAVEAAGATQTTSTTPSPVAVPPETLEATGKTDSSGVSRQLASVIRDAQEYDDRSTIDTMLRQLNRDDINRRELHSILMPVLGIGLEETKPYLTDEQRESVWKIAQPFIEYSLPTQDPEKQGASARRGSEIVPPAEREAILNALRVVLPDIKSQMQLMKEARDVALSAKEAADRTALLSAVGNIPAGRALREVLVLDDQQMPDEEKLSHIVEAATQGNLIQGAGGQIVALSPDDIEGISQVVYGDTEENHLNAINNAYTVLKKKRGIS